MDNPDSSNIFNVFVKVTYYHIIITIIKMGRCGGTGIWVWQKARQSLGPGQGHVHIGSEGGGIAENRS
jgi:hypothetical protein